MEMKTDAIIFTFISQKTAVTIIPKGSKSRRKLKINWKIYGIHLWWKVIYYISVHTNHFLLLLYLLCSNHRFKSINSSINTLYTHTKHIHMYKICTYIYIYTSLYIGGRRIMRILNINLFNICFHAFQCVRVCCVISVQCYLHLCFHTLVRFYDKA